MNLTEIKRENKQRDGGFQVFPFAAETVSQARQSTHSHSDGQVRSFNVASANQIAVGIADPRFNDCALQFGRRVAGRAFRHSSVNLDQLAIVNSRSETDRNGVRISGHAVSCKLKIAGGRLVQLFNEYLGVLSIATAKMPSQDQFASSLDCEKRPSIALSLVIRIPFVAFFAIAKSPKLVSLNLFSFDFTDAVLQKALALSVFTGLRSLASLRSGRRLSDVADVVLNELPVIAALHPHVGAAVGWLPVDRPAVRHDGELATLEEANHVLVGHVRVLAVLERRHVLRLVLDLTKRRNVRVVVGHDAVDGLAVLVIKPQLCCRPLLV